MATSKARRALTLPMAIHIGYMGRIDRSDAAARVRGLIQRQVLAPDTAFWRVTRVADGYAYEIHEGGRGRAYLPAILKRFASNPDTPVCVRTGNRLAQVTLVDGKPRSAELPAGATDEPDPIRPGPRMRRFAPTGYGALITCAILFGLGALSMGMAASALHSSRSVSGSDTPMATARRVSNLPIWHWPHDPHPNEYVSAVRFARGQWRVSLRPVARPKATRQSPAGRPIALPPPIPAPPSHEGHAK